jgi:Flp pilus assembly pilin Flp
MLHGQTMAEYALIVALVAIVGLAAWALLGTNISKAVSTVAGCVWWPGTGELGSKTPLKIAQKPVKTMHRFWRTCTHLPAGQTMAEYALIAALVAIVGLAAWALLGTNISQAVSSVAGCVWQPATWR